MANEAYRAVFLRVHPTGKMVLSLTTEADGNEPQYAQLVAERARRARARRQGRARPTPTASASATASTRAPSDGHVGGDHQRHREDPRQGAAAGRAWRSSAAPETPEVVQRRVGRRRRQRPDQVKTIEDIALYAHGTGELPPGVEGGLDAQTVYRD